jgi:hypothetical protein
MDVRCDAAMSGHSTEQEHLGESNTMSREESSMRVSFVFCVALQYQFAGLQDACYLFSKRGCILFYTCQFVC